MTNYMQIIPKTNHLLSPSNQTKPSTPAMQCDAIRCNALDAHHRMYNKSPAAGSVAEECWRPRIQGSSSQRGQHPLHSRPSLTTVCSIGEEDTLQLQACFECQTNLLHSTHPAPSRCTQGLKRSVKSIAHYPTGPLLAAL